MYLLLLNASNLHAGGGVQVATSVIGELTTIGMPSGNLVVWASSEVDSNLRRLGYDLTIFHAYEVIDTHGITLLYSPIIKRLQHFDAVFTIFGPLYVWKLKGVNITGFAQPWIIYPENEIANLMSCVKKFITRQKFKVQSIFFQRADQLVVELAHVRDRIVERGVGNPDSVQIVNNCLSALYRQPEIWQALTVPIQVGKFRLGFVGRNYPHKNTSIFSAVIEILRRDHGIDSVIYVTFTDDEWGACDGDFRAVVSNVGALSVSQCPTFYQSMDAVIFPSLLECFSATPLEAMAMERPLFASDRPFNRDVCGEYALYFDPMDPSSAAASIAKYLHWSSVNKEAAAKRLDAAKTHALTFSNAADRAQKYLDILVSSVEN